MDINTGGIADNYANFVWEPAVVKVSFCFYLILIFSLMLIFLAFSTFTMTLKPLLQINAINAATEAACLVLSVDETVKNPKVCILCFKLILILST